MALVEIPLTPSPQVFITTLAGVPYQFTVRFRDAVEGGWVLDIATENGTRIIGGIPLITGAELLAQYGYLAIVGALAVLSDADYDAVPTFDNLGKESHLYFFTDDLPITLPVSRLTPRYPPISNRRYSVLSPGALSSAFPVVRAQSGLTTRYNENNVLAYSAANLARFTGRRQRLMVEGPRQNSVIQSSTLTSWNLSGSVSRALAPAGSAPDGGNGAWRVTQTGAGQIDNRLGGFWPAGTHAISQWLKKVTTINNFRMYLEFVGAGPVRVATTQWQRLTELLNPQRGISYISDEGATAGTFDLFGLQIELNEPYVSSYMPTTNAVATRGRDDIAGLLTSVGITGACTITGVALAPQNAATAQQTIVSVNDNTDANAIVLENAPSGAAIQLVLWLSGAPVAFPLGNMVAGTVFSWALVLNGDGTGWARISGGAWVYFTNGPLNATVLRLGARKTVGFELFGELGELDATPGASRDEADNRMATHHLD